MKKTLLVVLSAVMLTFVTCDLSYAGNKNNTWRNLWGVGDWIQSGIDAISDFITPCEPKMVSCATQVRCDQATQNCTTILCDCRKYVKGIAEIPGDCDINHCNEYRSGRGN